MNLDQLERHILAERSRRMIADWEATIRERGCVPQIIVDESDDGTDRKRQLAALGNPRFAVIRVIVHPKAGGLDHDLNPPTASS
jgi:hypothetical protein